MNEKSDWFPLMHQEFQKEYMQNIVQFLEGEIRLWKRIFPQMENIFYAFEKTPFHSVQVIIIGQDPYHGEGQAHGLCFSVPPEAKIPPSLKNIFKELHQSLGILPSHHGDLTHWAEQWVLLLNSILSVEKWKPTSHSHIGWEHFTDEIIRQISLQKEKMIFLLWGAFAHSKESLIDTNKHFIFKTTHPSPFSAYRGFLWSHCFQKTNEILEKIGKKPIDWRLDHHN